MTLTAQNAETGSHSGSPGASPAGGVAARIAAGAGDAVRIAAAEAREALEAANRSVPGVARVSRESIDEAMRRLANGSDEQVWAAGSLSLGIVIGMVIAGAPRLFISLALISLAAIGMVMVDRRSSAGGRRSS